MNSRVGVAAACCERKDLSRQRPPLTGDGAGGGGAQEGKGQGVCEAWWDGGGATCELWALTSGNLYSSLLLPASLNPPPPSPSRTAASPRHSRPSAPQARVSMRVKPSGSLVEVMNDASCCKLSK
jgi:hypothetical protein